MIRNMLPHHAAKTFSSSLRKIAPIYFSAPLPKPIEPSLESCCGDECLHCVWVDYLYQDKLYRDTLKFMEQKLDSKDISLTNFDGVYYTNDPEVIDRIEQPPTGDIEMLKPIKQKPPPFFIP